MRYTIHNQVTSRPKRLNQLLYIIKGKNSVDKSQIIKAISQTYNIIGKINSIFINAPDRAIVDNIIESTLHIILGIDTQKTKKRVKSQ